MTKIFKFSMPATPHTNSIRLFANESECFDDSQLNNSVSNCQTIANKQSKMYNNFGKATISYIKGFTVAFFMSFLKIFTESGIRSPCVSNRGLVTYNTSTNNIGVIIGLKLSDMCDNFDYEMISYEKCGIENHAKSSKNETGVVIGKKISEMCDQFDDDVIFGARDKLLVNVFSTLLRQFGRLFSF